LEISILITFAAGLINVLGFVIYNWQASKSTVTPNLASWGIWAGVTIVNFTSYHSMSGDWAKSLLPAISSALCILTFLLILTKGGKILEMSKFDVVSLMIGFLSVVAWRLFRSATFANLIIQFAIILGFIPTLRAVIVDPRKEHPLPWFVWTVSYTLFVAVVLLRWTNHWQDLVYPAIGIISFLLITLLSKRSSIAR